MPRCSCIAMMGQSLFEGSEIRGWVLSIQDGHGHPATHDHDDIDTSTHFDLDHLRVGIIGSRNDGALPCGNSQIVLLSDATPHQRDFLQRTLGTCIADEGRYREKRSEESPWRATAYFCNHSKHDPGYVLEEERQEAQGGWVTTIRAKAAWVFDIKGEIHLAKGLVVKLPEAGVRLAIVTCGRFSPLCDRSEKTRLYFAPGTPEDARFALRWLFGFGPTPDGHGWVEAEADISVRPDPREHAVDILIAGKAPKSGDPTMGHSGHGGQSAKGYHEHHEHHEHREHQE